MALRHTLIPPTFSPMGEGESKVIKWVSSFQNCTGHCQRSPIFLALPETLKESVRLRGGERLEAGWTELRRIQISTNQATDLMSRPACPSTAGTPHQFSQLYFMEPPTHHMPHSCDTHWPAASFQRAGEPGTKRPDYSTWRKHMNMCIPGHGPRESEWKAPSRQPSFAGLREGEKSEYHPQEEAKSVEQVHPQKKYEIA